MRPFAGVKKSRHTPKNVPEHNRESMLYLNRVGVLKFASVAAGFQFLQELARGELSESRIAALGQLRRYAKLIPALSSAVVDAGLAYVSITVM